MLSKEEIELDILAQRIYRVQNYILEEIKEKGEISDFKEDVLYIIHNLLERQLSKEQQTACEIVVKNQNARIQIEKEKHMQRKIEQLESNNKKLIEKLEEDINESIKNIEEDERHDEWGYEQYKIQTLNKILKIAKGER